MPGAFHLDLRTPAIWRWGCRGLVSVAGWAGLYWMGVLAGLWADGAAAALACGLAVLCTVPWLPARAWPGSDGRLAWDGEHWAFTPSGDRIARGGQLQLQMDVGPALLLRFVADPASGEARGRRSHWLPLSAANLAGHEVHALRLAVYCRRPEATPADLRDTDPHQ